MKKHKYPLGTHVYVLEDNNMFKIGYTDNLAKRLATYNTGKADKSDYAYYKKTNCGREIEKCMKAILNKYIYKSNKEFYNCSLEKIIQAINTCIKAEKNSDACNKIQTGGGLPIIDSLISLYKDKHKYYSSFL
jgi:predicted GIY-YIG superfamily endonuclease